MLFALRKSDNVVLINLPLTFRNRQQGTKQQRVENVVRGKSDCGVQSRTQVMKTNVFVESN